MMHVWLCSKTETVKLVLGHLATIAEHGESTKSIVERVLRAGPLLESFGNAATLRNGNSSRFAKFLRVEFQRHGMTMEGSWCETALLEKTRVVERPPGERSFHIFYELETQGRYVQPVDATATASARRARGRDDKRACTELRESLRLLETLRHDEVDNLLACIAAVTSLGDIVVEPAEHEGASCRVVGGLEHAATLLGCDPAKLRAGLVRRDVRGHQVSLDVAAALAARDALAKEMYRRIFEAVVTLSNEATTNLAVRDSSGDTALRAERVVVGMLDLFGFEVYTSTSSDARGCGKNGFEQLLINFANERLQQRFVADVLSRAQQELVAEGVPWQRVEYDDNAEILRLIEGRAGLIDILNEECIRGASGTDVNFVHKLLAVHKGNPHLATPRIRMHDKHDAQPFSITHYAGEVLYMVDMWVDTNRDVLPTFLEAALVDAACGSQGKVGTPAQVFATYAVAAAKKKGRKRSGSQLSTSETVASKFRLQLRELMLAVGRTKCRYVRCVRPNDAARPMGSQLAFQRASVVEQLRCCGVLSALRVARAGYPDRKPLQGFVERFAVCAPQPTVLLAQCRHAINQEAQGDHASSLSQQLDDDVDEEFALDPAVAAACAPWRETASSIITAIDAAHSRGYISPVSRRRRAPGCGCAGTMSMRVFIGKTKVFLRDGALDELERLRGGACYDFASKIQAAARGCAHRRGFKRTLAAAIKCQSIFRRFIAAAWCEKTRCRLRALTKLQALCRTITVRNIGYYRRGKRAAIVIESKLARPVLAKAKLKRKGEERAKGRRLDSISAKLRDISKRNVDVGDNSKPAQPPMQPNRPTSKLFSSSSNASKKVQQEQLELFKAEAAATVAAAREVAADAGKALDELRRENAMLRDRCTAAEARAEAWRTSTSKAKQREAQLLAMVDEARRDAKDAHDKRRKASAAAAISQNGSEAANTYSRLRQQILNANNITPQLRKKILEKRRPNRSVTVTQQQLRDFRNMLVTGGLDVLKHSTSGKAVRRRLKLTENGNELYWVMPDGHSARSRDVYPLAECQEVRAAHDVDPDFKGSKLVCGTKTLRRSMEAKNWALAFSFIYASRTIDVQLSSPEETKVVLRYCKALVQEARAKALKQLLQHDDDDAPNGSYQSTHDLTKHDDMLLSLQHHGATVTPSPRAF